VGDGDTDNGSFLILGNQLRMAAAVDFETKSTYGIRVRSTDQSGGFVERVIAISVNDIAE
jgi:hypothetical protein